MRKFVLTRIAGLIIVLLAMTLLIFLLRQVVPSDPARAAVGPNAPEEVVQLKREELGLDKPVYTQYFDYLGNVVQGDFGTSTRTLAPVSEDIRTYFPASLELMIAAILIAAVLAAALALGQTLLRRSGFLRVVLLGGASAPIFLTAELLLLFCWFKLDWLPGGGRTELADAPTGPTGLLTVDSVLAGRPDAFWDACLHLLLPAFTLALPMGVAVGRTLRSSLVGTTAPGLHPHGSFEGLGGGQGPPPPCAAQLRDGRAGDGRPPGRAAARQPARGRADLRVAGPRRLHRRVARTVGPVGRPRRRARVRRDLRRDEHGR